MEKLEDSYKFERNYRRVRRIFLGGLAWVGWLGGLSAINGSARNHSEIIRDEPHLEEMVIVERNRLNLSEDVIINTRLNPNSGFSGVWATGENTYEMVLNKRGQNVGTLRHELYHIADGHSRYHRENFKRGFWNTLGYFLKYTFINEPQAALYGAFGWKL